MNNNDISSDQQAPAGSYDRFRSECWAEQLAELHVSPDSYTAQVGRCIFDRAFRQAYLLGAGEAYASNNITRLEVATAAMQGILASGYIPELGDIPAEAVRLADRLIEELSKPSRK